MNEQLHGFSEAQLWQLATLGLHSSTIIHELNNAINAAHANFEAIKGYVDGFVALYAFAEGLPKSEQMAKAYEDLKTANDLVFAVGDIGDAVSGCALGMKWAIDILQTTRRYQKKAFSHGESINLVAVVEENIAFMKCIGKAHIRFSFTCETGEAKAQLDPIKLNQVLSNILLNAVQAIGHRDGVIDVRCSLNQGRFQIAITDSGVGIKDEDLPRLFSPYFTTKGEEGTGLGLFIVKTLMDSLGGSVRVHSQVDVGTTFELSLPLLEVA